MLKLAHCSGTFTCFTVYCNIHLGWNRTLERVLEILTLASDFLQLSTNPWKQNSTGGCLLTRGCILRCKNHDRSVKAEPGGVHTQGRRQQGASAETSRWQALKRSRMNQKRALSATNGRCATKQAGRIATRDHWKRSMYKGRSVHAEKKIGNTAKPSCRAWSVGAREWLRRVWSNVRLRSVLRHTTPIVVWPKQTSPASNENCRTRQKKQTGAWRRMTHARNCGAQ